MATAIPAGGRLLGEVVRGLITAEKLRRLAQAIPQEQTKEGDYAGEKDETQCNQCKLHTGVLLPAKPRRAIRKQNKINWDYQLYIANMNASPERFVYCDKDTGQPLGDFDFSLAARAINAVKGVPQPNPEQLNLTEWLYSGVWFDGFWRDKCTVVDAKGQYKQFLDEDNEPNKGFPAIKMFPEMIQESASQNSAINDARPQASLEWHFLQIELWSWAQSNLPASVRCIHTPWLPMVEA
ncbi:Tox-REase-5 domain-containing protein [Xanthomonas translucens]|uniref:Tox-REase-5 domain-containing protein n=1 Tax=Xanthomonas campestris pv. translucens TaxID=343 RepID=UPI0007627C61|nr:Tox-REase-5 domain-containing protein [Xanthomonas translucens]KWV16742.1 hypothetical protein ATB54_07575 [Xanthomonas translucens]